MNRHSDDGPSSWGELLKQYRNESQRISNNNIINRDSSSYVKPKYRGTVKPNRYDVINHRYHDENANKRLEKQIKYQKELLNKKKMNRNNHAANIESDWNIINHYNKYEKEEMNNKRSQHIPYKPRNRLYGTYEDDPHELELEQRRRHHQRRRYHQTSNHQQRDYDILAYDPNIKTRASSSSTHLRRHQLSNDYDPIAGRYKSASQEHLYQLTQKQKRQQRLKQRSAKLPKSMKQNDAYDIVTMNVKHADLINELSVKTKSPTYVNKHDFEKKVRLRSDEAMNTQQARSLNRISYDRFKHEYNRGYDPISQTTFKGYNSRRKYEPRVKNNLKTKKYIDRQTGR